jgi:hypothetical protein
VTSTSGPTFLGSVFDARTKHGVRGFNRLTFTCISALHFEQLLKTNIKVQLFKALADLVSIAFSVR